MAGFLAHAVKHFRSLPSLRGWDSWNELRWSEKRRWHRLLLSAYPEVFPIMARPEYGGLDGLNQRWHRRYTSWDDVRPGKFPRCPYNGDDGVSNVS